MARIFQHEIDHLNGILMVDNSVEIMENTRYNDYVKKLENNSI